MLVWHVPVLYDTALRVQPIHDLEHLTYIVTGLLFWNHALAIPPFARSLDWPRRVVYAGSAMLVGWVLAIVLATAPHALYAYYSQQHTRPGGISAVADQHIAAGIMWVPGSIAFTIAFTIAGYRWLEPSKPAAPRGASAAT
jgi:cytochrome c oxidase assembly factor CtaG